MKRLLSVMVLAGVPVACGIQTSSTPDGVTQPAAGDTGSFAASAARRGPVCMRGDRSHVRSIQLAVVDQGPGFVTVRAQIAQANAETSPPVCLEPSWQVTPMARLDPFSDREQVTVYGEPGKYQLTGTSLVGTGGRLRASIRVAIE